jgi:hypothetical protein
VDQISFAELAMQTLEHPLMGHLDWHGAATTCDWVGTIVLPTFAECYDKWNSDGTEFFRDRRSNEHRRGEFAFLVCSGSPRVGFGHGKEIDEIREPSVEQCVAYTALVEQQACLANNLTGELVKQVRSRGSDWYLLNKDEFERLLRPDYILGTLELQSICITYHSRDGAALVGLTFHSEIWESEHGLGAVVLRDQVVLLGAAEDAWPDSMMGDP